MSFFTCRRNTLFLLFILFSGLLRAQPYLTYVVDSGVPYKWEDFATYQPTELLALSGEDEVYAVPLPFPFTFFGGTYNEIFVSINGNATFGRSYSQGDFNREHLCQPVPQLYNPAGEQNSLNPDNFIAVFWDDLFLSPLVNSPNNEAPKLAYRTVQNGASREFVVVWDHFIRSADAYAVPDTNFDALLSVELRLYETTNVIEVHIRRNDLLSQEATIAVENLDGSYAAYANCAGDADPNPGSSTVAYRFTPSELPDNTVPSYCAAKGGSCLSTTDPASPEYDRIVSATVTEDGGTMVNNSGCNDGYGDFTADTSKWITWTMGRPYQITLDREVNYTFGQAAAWVDWNNDFDFFDTGEQLTGNYNSATATAEFVVIPPDSFSTGFKRLRVRVTSVIPDQPLPCGTQPRGEVEDYTIILLDSTKTPPPCASALMPVDNATDQCQRVRLNWSAVTGTTGYRLNLMEESPGTAYVIRDSVVSQPGLDAPLLTPGTSYKWIAVPFNDDGDAFACDTFRFSTSADPDPVADISPQFEPVALCENVPLQLDGNPTLGTLPYTHSWNGTDNTLLSDPATSNPVFAGAASGTYTYSYDVTDSKGCKGSDTVTIEIVPGVSAGTLQSDAPGVCSGNSALLTAVGSAGNVILQDSLPGQPWVNSGAVMAGPDSWMTGPLTATRAYRTVAGAGGSCSDTSEVLIITVNNPPAPPVIATSGSTSFCETGSVILYTTNYTSGIRWNDAASTANDSLVVTKAGSYRATYTDNIGCTSQSANVVTTTVTAPNKPQIQILGNQETCIGDTLTLFVNNPNNDVISWNDNSNTVNDSLEVFTAGSYVATATNSTGCTNKSDALVLTFDYRPEAPIISAIGEDFLCTGDSVTLFSSYPQGNRWSNGSNSSQIVIYQTGVYSVTYTSPEGCTSQPASYSVSIGATPAQPQINQVGDSLISSVTGYSYQWIGPEGPIAGANQRSYRPRLTGDYRVVVYTEEGCASRQSPPYYRDLTGISENSLQGIALYPNPAHDFATISVETLTNDTVRLRILNVMGAEVHYSKLAQGENLLDISGLPAGTYFMVITSGDKVLNRPLVKY